MNQTPQCNKGNFENTGRKHWSNSSRYSQGFPKRTSVAQEMIQSLKTVIIKIRKVKNLL